MANMYAIIRFLCQRDEISIAQMCRETGLRQGLISDLKHGRTKSLSAANMQKISHYFQVSTDIFNEGAFDEALPNTADLDLLREIQNKYSVANKKALADEGEGDLADYLQDLRERPETRALLEASRGMTKEQVEQMAAFAKALRGGG